MKKKVLKLVASIVAVLVLTPIFVIGIINLPSLFPKGNETTIEEVKVYQPRDVNEQFNYEEGDFDDLTNKDEFTYSGKNDYKINDYIDKNLFGSTTKFVAWDSNAQDFVGSEVDSYRGGTSVVNLVKNDDPIVNLIPRELFNCRGAYTIVGKEWGALRFRPSVKSSILVGLV